MPKRKLYSILIFELISHFYVFFPVCRYFIIPKYYSIIWEILNKSDESESLVNIDKYHREMGEWGPGATWKEAINFCELYKLNGNRIMAIEAK